MSVQGGVAAVGSQGVLLRPCAAPLRALVYGCTGIDVLPRDLFCIGNYSATSCHNNT